MLNVEEKELLNLWLADKIIEVIADEIKFASKSLGFVIETLKKQSISWLIIICNGSLSETDELIGKIFQNRLMAGLLSIVFFIIEGVVVKSLYDKYQNHSNIKLFKESINIPKEMKPL